MNYYYILAGGVTYFMVVELVLDDVQPLFRRDKLDAIHFVTFITTNTVLFVYQPIQPFWVFGALISFFVLLLSIGISRPRKLRTEMAHSDDLVQDFEIQDV